MEKSDFGILQLIAPYHMSSDIQQMYMEQFRSAGVMPTGPISPWPQGREIRTMAQFQGKGGQSNANKVKASRLEQLQGLGRTIAQGAKHGKVSLEIRNERLETCFNCPHFIESSARCNLCGCFMKAKTFVAGDKDRLCPGKKWKR